MDKIKNFFTGSKKKNKTKKSSPIQMQMNIDPIQNQMNRVPQWNVSKTSSKARDEMLKDVELIKRKTTNDDTKVEIDVKTQVDAVHFRADSRYQKIKKIKEKQDIPVMLTLQTDDLELDSGRVGIDLVVVIDVSSSMSGQKIKLVRETLLFIIDELQQIDRLSLVKFNSNSDIILGLTPMIQENKKMAKELIKEHVIASSCTNITAALGDAYDVLLNRKQVNELTSIFFLSDGDDTCGNSKESIISFMESRDAMMIKKNMDYKINSFGYGEDHDEEVLCSLSNLKSGNFFYIKDLKLVDECFIECLGNLMTVFAKNAVINVMLAEGVEFVKKHGENWDSDNNKSKSVLTIGSIYTEMLKNYMFEVKVPVLPENQTSFKVADVSLKFNIKDESFSKDVEVTLELTDSDDLGKVNEEVEENLNRVQAAILVREVQEDFKQGRKTLGKQKMQHFKMATAQNQYLKSAYIDNMNDLMDEEEMEDDKYGHQMTEMMSKQAYVPGFKNITKERSYNKKTKARKKGI